MSTTPRDQGIRQLLNAMRTPAPTKFAPLVGLAIGAVGGAAYWLSAQLWPSSIALVFCLLAGALLTNDLRDAGGASRLEILSQLFYVILKYNVLMRRCSVGGPDCRSQPRRANLQPCRSS